MVASLGRSVPVWYRPERHRLTGVQLDARTRANTHRRGKCTREGTAVLSVGWGQLHIRVHFRVHY